MTTKTRQVISPAGDIIQITSDEDWLDAVGGGPNALRQWGGGAKPFILRALWEHGEFTEKSGRVGTVVQSYIRDNYREAEISDNPSSVMALFRNPVNYPAVMSQMNGKRTFSLKLAAMPEIWYAKLMDDIGPGTPSTNGDQAEPVDADREAAEQVAALVLPQGEQFTDADWADLKLDAPTVFDEPAPMDVHIANQVAVSLLTTVVEIITAGKADTAQLSGSKRLQGDLDHARELLSARLSENDKLRRQLREAGDMISALKVERDGIRSRLHMTERNLSEVLKGETAQAVNAEIHKRVDQIMRTAPASPKVE
jgi:hypothetical protein